MEKEIKKLTLTSFIAYIVGFLFLIAGFITLISNIISGASLIFASFLIFPPVYKMLEEKTKISLSRTLRIIFAIIFIAVAGSSTMKDGERALQEIKNGEAVENKTVQKNVSKSEKERVQISALELEKEFKANAVAAEEKYKDKILVVSGVIGSIDRDIADTPFITLKGENQFVNSVQCMFDRDQTGELSKLSKDQRVTIEGEFSSKMVYVLLRQCKVAN